MAIKSPSAILFDLDDTLIPSSQFYAPAVTYALQDHPDLLPLYDTARQAVKRSLPDLHTSARNRQIYFKRLVELAEDTSTTAVALYDRYEAELSRMIREWSAQSQRLQLIRTLQSRYPTYILTNETVRAQLMKIDALCQGQPHGFRGIMCSEEVGFEKPHRRMFEALLERYRLNPERCLFVGDSIENDIRAARGWGMDVVQSCEFIKESPMAGTRSISNLAELLDELA